MEVRRAGLSALRCHAQPGDRRERQEIPTWMFDQAACSRMQVARDPRASCSALLDLQRLLNATRLEQTPDTVQRPPHSKEAGTDVTATTHRILGRPGLRDRQRQYLRAACRCHETTVAGLTTTNSAVGPPGAGVNAADGRTGGSLTIHLRLSPIRAPTVHPRNPRGPLHAVPPYPLPS